jgi:hypothetical protein
MDDHSGVDLACHNGGHDPVKTHHPGRQGKRGIHPQQHSRRGVHAGDGDGQTGQLLGKEIFPCDQQRPAASAKGASGHEQDIPVKDMAQGVKRKLGNIKPVGKRPLIEGFNVGKRRLAKSRGIAARLPMHQGMEDECIVGAGRETEGKFVFFDKRRHGFSAWFK